VTDGDMGNHMAGCHELLLWLAGRLPDDVMTRCREQLAQGAQAEVARAVVFCVLSQNLALTSAEVTALTSLLTATGGDPSALSEVEIDDSAPLLWAFSDDPAGPAGAGAADAGAGAADAGAGTGEAGPGDAHDMSTAAAKLDQAMAEALAEEPGAIGCWRAWRVPLDDAPAARAKAVFTVEVGRDTDLPGAAGRLQQRLAAAGEASPQIEVYPLDYDLPLYQRLARGYGELVWAAMPDPGMRVAWLFDEVDPQEGPRFSPDHPRLPEEEAGKVAQYLGEAEPVLVTSARMDDVVDAGRQYCVPVNFRTDGTWIWTDASAYYAQEHLLEPDPELLAHIRSNAHTLPLVDGVAVHRALEVLQHPPETDPVWTFDGQEWSAAEETDEAWSAAEETDEAWSAAEETDEDDGDTAEGYGTGSQDVTAG
jgi:hypothetical protein